MKKYFNLFAKTVLFGSISLLLACTTSQTMDSNKSIRKTSSTPALVAWSSVESQDLFERSNKTDFYPLANQFEAQLNKFYCGPATAVVILNALRMSNDKIKKPEDPKLFRGSVKTIPKGYNPVFARYTQDQFFTPETDKIKTRAQVFGAPMPGQAADSHDYGIQLRQLATMLESHKLKIDLRVADGSLTDTTIRNEIIENLQSKNDYVIVNFDRKTLGQAGGGHIAPMAAYDKRSDSVLILDINPSHQPWTWVKIDDLIAAMRTKDTVENRGYLLVEEGIK